MLRMGHTYRGGPLAPAGPAGAEGPTAGDRAPDAPCHRADGRRVRLFDLRRGGHRTLYGFGVRPRPPHPAVRAVTIDGEVGGEITDTGGLARRAYAATEGECVLVRPDGHIALRTHDQAAIDAYLRPALPPFAQGPSDGSPWKKERRQGAPPSGSWGSVLSACRAEPS
ncbi:hypothetical protein [Streptomyces sp. OE57]|uniref:aromatic-ring hydroxylase C-terminal domain-containing protein n=1 Tax=Streptomyces lacaronensis TaxID=3379885 RepID=UPI0039B73E5E